MSEETYLVQCAECTEDTYSGTDESAACAVEFGGERGFAEMLYSLTDNEYLLREGHLQVTQEFVDSYTGLVKVMAPFFAPDAGVMAVVTIYASLLSPTGVKFSYSIDFFNMLRYCSHALKRLMLCSCFAHALLMLCSCFTHALLMLYSLFLFDRFLQYCQRDTTR